MYMLMFSLSLHRRSVCITEATFFHWPTSAVSWQSTADPTPSPLSPSPSLHHSQKSATSVSSRLAQRQFCPIHCCLLGLWRGVLWWISDQMCTDQFIMQFRRCSKTSWRSDCAEWCACWKCWWVNVNMNATILKLEWYRAQSTNVTLFLSCLLFLDSSSIALSTVTKNLWIGPGVRSFSVSAL